MSNSGGKPTGGRKGRRPTVKKSLRGQEKALAARVNRIEKSLIETKYVDDYTSTTASNATATANSNTLNLMAQGDTVMTRNGNKIFMTHAEIKYYVQNNSVLTGPVNIRVMVLYDASPSGQANSLCIAGTQIQFGPTGVLDNTVITGSPQIMPHAFEMKYRYKVLYDKIHTLNPLCFNGQSITNNTSATATITGTSVENLQQLHHCVIPLNKQTVFQDGTANLSSVLKGSLVGFWCSDQSSNLPFVVFGSRIFFKDA